jgi:hypothetical protein
MRDHRTIDERSLALCQAIVGHLQEDPEPVNVAKANITRWKNLFSQQRIHARRMGKDPQLTNCARF